MKAVVLGGAGLTGRCTVRDLARHGLFEDVVAADLDRAAAERFAREAGGPARAEALDVRDPSALRRLLTGAAVCVNAVQYGFNLEVMAACLDVGVPYLDFGGLFHMTRRQLQWDDRFRAAGLLAIPGLGQVPGVSNILAMAACADLDRVDTIVIRDGWTDLTENGPELVFSWSPSTFLDEMVQPAMLWQDGAYREAPPMSGAEEFDFPEPVGRTRVYRTLHSEPATLPTSLASKGLRHCEWKEGGPGIDVLRHLSLLGFGSDEPVLVDGRPVSPKRMLLALLRERQLLGYPAGVTINDWEVCALEVRGSQGAAGVHREAFARFPPRPDWHLSATEYGVGVAGAIGAEMIAQGRLTAVGVVPPEMAVPAAPFREALAERGIETCITPPEKPLKPLSPRKTTTSTNM